MYSYPGYKIHRQRLNQIYCGDSINILKYYDFVLNNWENLQEDQQLLEYYLNILKQFDTALEGYDNVVQHLIQNDCNFKH